MTDAINSADLAKREFDAEAARAQFPQLADTIRGKRLVYLDNAASTLKPLAVIERLDAYYRHEASNVHRGAHWLSAQATCAYEAAREQAREFLGARAASEIVFTRGTTESINLVAQSWGRASLRPGDEILVSELEHHSNIVPWQMIAEQTGAVLRPIPIDERGDVDFGAFERMLTKRAKMVALSWCSNALGSILPAQKFVEAAHAAGARVLIDAAQSVSSIPAGVARLGCDFLAFSGHKIFGPYGIGVLYGKSELFESMPPYQGGGSMIAEVAFERSTWAAVPQKFEAGTPAISGAIGLAAALQYVQRIGLGAIERYEAELLAYALERLRQVPGLRIVGEPRQRAAIVSFLIDGAHPSDVAAIVDNEGIAIRAGHHCCQPLMRRLGITGTCRASLSLYNAKEDVDALARGLEKAKEFF
jgi:cysteine desulfurase/selenocysteine lyase